MRFEFLKGSRARGSTRMRRFGDGKGSDTWYLQLLLLECAGRTIWHKTQTHETRRSIIKNSDIEIAIHLQNLSLHEVNKVVPSQSHLMSWMMLPCWPFKLTTGDSPFSISHSFMLAAITGQKNMFCTDSSKKLSWWLTHLCAITHVLSAETVASTFDEVGWKLVKVTWCQNIG